VAFEPVVSSIAGLVAKGFMIVLIEDSEYMIELSDYGRW